jgi:hypothetical protein
LDHFPSKHYPLIPPPEFEKSLPGELTADHHLAKHVRYYSAKPKFRERSYRNVIFHVIVYWPSSFPLEKFGSDKRAQLIFN